MEAVLEELGKLESKLGIDLGLPSRALILSQK